MKYKVKVTHMKNDIKSQKSDSRLDAPLLTEKEVSDFLNISVRTLQKWRWNGRGPNYLKLSGCVRYSISDIKDFLKQGKRRNTSDSKNTNKYINIGSTSIFKVTFKIKEKEIMPEIKEDKSLPNDLDAEQAVLSAMMKDQESLKIGTEILSCEHFFWDVHKKLFCVLSEMALNQESVDLYTLKEKLNKKRWLKIISGITILTSIMGCTATTTNITHHAKIVQDKHIRRKFLQEIENVKSGIETEDIQDLLQNHMLNVSKLPDELTLKNSKTVLTINGADLIEQEFPEIKFAIPDILPEGFSILAGNPKQGKSFLALDIALGVSQGGNVMGSIPVQQGEVLFIGLEDSQRRLQERIKMHNTTSNNLINFSTELPILSEGGFTMVDNWATSHPKAKLIVIGTLGRVKPQSKRNTNVYLEDVNFGSLLQNIPKKHNLTLLGLHHLRKAETANSDPINQITGSPGLPASADTIWLLDRKRGKSDASLKIFGHDIEDQDLSLKFVNGLWTLLGESRKRPSSKLQLEIFNLLAKEKIPLKPATIAEKLEKTVGSIKGTIHRLIHDGILQKTEKGEYYCYTN